MKKILFAGFALFTILAFGALSTPNTNGIAVENKDTKLPDWQWASGDIPMKKTAAKQSFTISFSPKIYRSRDSVKITFTSYKVAITNLSQGTNVNQWKGKMSLVYYLNINWIPLVADTNDRINCPFSGKNNITVDSLTKYSIRTTVPLSRTLTLSASALYLEMNGRPMLAGAAGGPMLSTSIKGIEIKKLE